MSELTLYTPSILFSAISLIMLAYTNRFLSYAQVVRNLKAEHDKNPSNVTRLQLANLRRRLYMARSMQMFGISSLLLCVACTFMIYIGLQTAAAYIFGIALVLLVISLGISIREVLISVKALELHLDDLERMKVLTRTGRSGVYENSSQRESHPRREGRQEGRQESRNDTDNRSPKRQQKSRPQPKAAGSDTETSAKNESSSKKESAATQSVSTAQGDERSEEVARPRRRRNNRTGRRAGTGNREENSAAAETTDAKESAVKTGPSSEASPAPDTTPATSRPATSESEA